MISFSAGMVAEAANTEIQRDLFRLLADHLALDFDSRPGLVMVLDMEALRDPDAMLAYLNGRCSPSAN